MGWTTVIHAIPCAWAWRRAYGAVRHAAGGGTYSQMEVISVGVMYYAALFHVCT